MRLLIVLALISACSKEVYEKERVEQPPLVPAYPIPEPIPAQPIPQCPACPACPGQPTPTPYPGESVIVRAINAARKLKGLGPVSEDSKLDCAAQAHARDISVSKVCGHIGSDGSQFWQRAQKCGTQALGEIVACGYPNAVSAVEGWDRSPGHAAIMYGQYGKVGVGEVDGYWVAVFAE